MPIFDPKAIDPKSGLPLGDPRVTAQDIARAQAEGVGIPSDPKQQSPQQKAILQAKKQAEENKRTAAQAKKQAKKQAAILSQAQAALLAGASIDIDVLAQAGVASKDIVRIKRLQDAVRKLKRIPGAQATGGFDLVAALKGGASVKTLADAGFNPQDIDQAQAALKQQQVPSQAIETPQAIKATEIDPSQAKALKAIRKIPGVEAPNGEFYLETAIQGGASIKTLLDAGFALKDINQAKTAIRDARQAAIRQAKDDRQVSRSLAVLDKAPGVKDGNSYDLVAALDTGISPKTIKAAGFKLADITKAETILKAERKEREARAAAEQEVAPFITKGGPIDSPPGGAFVPAGELPGFGDVIDIDRAIRSGIKDKTLKDLGVSQADIAKSKNRLRFASDLVAVEGPTGGGRRRVKRTTPRPVPRFETPFPRATPTKRPPPGEKLPVPKALNRDLRRFERGEPLLAAGSLAGGIAPTALTLDSQIRLATAQQIRKAIEQGDLPPEQAREALTELQATPTKAGSMRDAAYIVPGLGTFLSYQDARRAGFSPLTTGFFIFSAALDALIIFTPAVRGGGAVVIRSTEGVRKITPSKARRIIEKIPPRAPFSEQVRAVPTAAPKPRGGRLKKRPFPDPPVTLDPSRAGRASSKVRIGRAKTRLHQARKEARVELSKRKAVIEKTTAIGSTPRIGDKPGQVQQVRTKRGDVGVGGETFQARLTAPVGSKFVGIIIEPPKPPPFPVLGASPLGDLPSAPPRGGRFTWTLEAYDKYIDSLRNSGVSPQAIARAEQLRDWARQKQAGGAPTAMLEDFSSSHPMPTPQSWWERPQPSVSRSRAALRQASQEGIRLNKRLKQLSKNPASKQDAAWGAANASVLDALLRAEVAVAKQRAALQTTAAPAQLAGSIGASQGLTAAQTKTLTSVIQGERTATKSLTQALTKTTVLAKPDMASLTSLLTKTQPLTQTQTQTLQKLLTRLQLKTINATADATKPSLAIRQRTEQGKRVVPTTPTKPATHVVQKPATIRTLKVATPPVLQPGKTRTPPPPTRPTLTPGTPVTPRRTIVRLPEDPDLPTKLKPPPFKLPDGRTLSPGEYPDIMTWKQGIAAVRFSMSSGKATFSRATSPGQPEETFRVISFTRNAPDPRTLKLGVMNVVIRRDGLKFRRSKRTTTLDKQRPTRETSSVPFTTNPDYALNVGEPLTTRPITTGPMARGGIDAKMTPAPKVGSKESQTAKNLFEYRDRAIQNIGKQRQRQRPLVRRGKMI